MFTYNIPIGGYTWGGYGKRKRTEVPLTPKMNDKGELHFRYEWKSEHFKMNYEDRIPCNIRVKFFDNHIHILEVQLAQHTRLANATGNHLFANDTSKRMQQEIKRFEDDSKNEKFFY
ncbi:hypothetical protein GUITHDRAFT_118923 [Guillardia theta CCMP2712]|uniref:Uncharacterized protein n=1 Tax=Guillardia theta (strain CCMP2712) TaxID=905079 RepID=L1IF83_GUITC|nr:hypothetical protein GUITHDRAFT_118923 [Guillardia theta CCMP2712]EKX34883.1 hypothetical protein GUITHDRAFT_118923 [Guillardia theta CCMP2712]|eukprot:XP_005821863.1 hypothetical protein GUITHDRAFT_118923 [Guillardia theta CCMP2712]